jgi:hypothetical protein
VVFICLLHVLQGDKTCLRTLTACSAVAAVSAHWLANWLNDARVVCVCLLAALQGDKTCLRTLTAGQGARARCAIKCMRKMQC